MKKIVLLLAVILLSGCCAKPGPEKEKAIKVDEEVIRPIRYNVGESFHVVEKMVIEGHEYLMFSSKTSSHPPTVIHSESCPCHNN